MCASIPSVKRDLRHKLKKKDMLLDEERSERESLEKERNALRKEVKDLTKLADQQKAQLAKKEKTIKETTDEMEEYKSKLDMIFNMSKKLCAVVVMTQCC